MIFEEIIHSVNALIRKERSLAGIEDNSYLTIMRNTQRATACVGAFKTYSIKLYWVKKDKNVLIFSCELVSKVTSQAQEDKAKEDIENLLFQNILNILYNSDTNILKQIIEGTYNVDTIK